MLQIYPPSIQDYYTFKSSFLCIIVWWLHGCAASYGLLLPVWRIIESLSFWFTFICWTFETETNPSDQGSKLRRLPKELRESVEALAGDEILNELIGKKLVTSVIGIRKVKSWILKLVTNIRVLLFKAFYSIEKSLSRYFRHATLFFLFIETDLELRVSFW